MRTVLLTLGRLPKALDLARGFAAAGWRVVVAEPFAAHLCASSRAVARCVAVPAPAAGKHAYLDALRAVIAAERADLVLPVSEETMHVCHLAGEAPVFAMPPSVLLPAYDKGGFIRIAQAAGLAVPETHALGSPEAAALAARGRVVVKPVHACSGRGVRVLARGAPLPPPDTPSVVQAFVAGEVHSTCSVAHAGRVTATVVYRGLMFAGSVAIAFERVAHPAIEAWVARFAAATGWTGFLSFDFVVDADGTPFGIECNPRTTSGLHFFQSADLPAAVLDPGAAPRLRGETRLQQAWSCLTETQASLLDRRRFARNLATLTRTRDVTWDRRDPWPFLAMPWTSRRILALAIARGVPFGEVATLDVGWYEDQPASAAAAASRPESAALAMPAPGCVPAPASSSPGSAVAVEGRSKTEP